MNYFKLARTPLFAGTTEEEIKQMLTCLKAVERNYKERPSTVQGMLRPRSGWCSRAVS